MCGALETSRLLFNAGLEERSGAWRKAKLRIGLHDQYKSLTLLSGDPSLRGLPVHLLRWSLKRLEFAFKGFFERVRQGQVRSARGSLEKPGIKVAQKSGLNRSIGYASWGRFITFLVTRPSASVGELSV